MSEYGGESNAKKVARAKLWAEVWALVKGQSKKTNIRTNFAQQMATHAGAIVETDVFETVILDNGRQASFDKMPIVMGTMSIAVLSGPEGHDVRAALSVGAVPHLITAIDIDEKALHSAKSAIESTCKDLRWPRQNASHAVTWENRDFYDVISERPFGIIFMDACSPILRTAKKTIGSFMEAAQRAPVITTLETTAAMRAASVRASESRECIMFVGGMYGRDGRWTEPTRNRHEPQNADTRRALRFFEEMCTVSAEYGCIFHPGAAISYSSHRLHDDGKVRGTPMLYAGGLLQSFPNVYNTNRRNRRHVLKQLKSVNRKKLNDMMPYWRRSGMVSSIGSDVDGSKLRRHALEVARGAGAEFAAHLHCLPKSTVSAWLAHETRGTYEKHTSP